MTSGLDHELKSTVQAIDNKKLQEMLEYALFPGKRIRGSLLLACVESHARVCKSSVKAAAAIEITHAFSLVHDDMPALDNSDYRRGKLSFFKKYGDDNALLVGDLLQYLAQYKLKDAPQLLGALIESAGHNGMVFGQWLECNTRPVSLAELQKIQDLKTAKLFQVSGELASIILKADANLRNNITQLCFIIGRCLQWFDDIEDQDEDSPGTNILHFCTQSELDKKIINNLELINNIAESMPNSFAINGWLSEFFSKYDIAYS